MKHKRYTEDEDEVIAAWYGKIRIDSISRLIGREVSSIYGRIHRKGIKRHNSTGNFLVVHDRDEIKKHITKGKATRQIVPLLGISENYLRKIVKEELPEKYYTKLIANGKKNRKNKSRGDT